MRCDRYDTPVKTREEARSDLYFEKSYDLTQSSCWFFYDLLNKNKREESLEAQFIESLLYFVQDSPFAHYLLEFIKGTSWKIGTDDLGSSGFHIDAQKKEIILDHFGLEWDALERSPYFKMSLIYTLLKALRDIWHEEQWDDLKSVYCPESVLQLERARAADGDTASIIMAWELRGAGRNGLWRHVLSAEEGDMARVLINILDRYPTALYNGMAHAHVFRQWYADENRIDAQDHASLEYFDKMLDVDDEFFGERRVKADSFEQITLLPDGSSYLTELGDIVSSDPFFAGLNDPVNQAHLFQIIYDNNVTMVKDIPFRDASLARRFMD